MKVNEFLGKEELDTLAGDMERLRLSVNALCKDEADIVLAVRRKLPSGGNGVFVLSKLEPGDCAELLWYALGDVQKLVQAMQPPSRTIQ